MTESEARIAALAKCIPEPDETMLTRARQRQAQLIKPPGALGRLEALAIQIAALTGQERPPWQQRQIVVFAGDHGVASAGVSAYPSAVTAQMVHGFCHGTAAINALARAAGSRLLVVDVGVATDFPPELPIVHRKIRPGTRSFLDEPALSRDETIAAIAVGVEVIAGAGRIDLLALGEMGIGNTTAAAAVASALLSTDPADLVGRGTGVDEAGLARKLAVVRCGLARHQPNPDDPIGVLAAVGGLEIAALVGAMLAAAARRIPILLDGFIGGAAALAAVRYAPSVRPYLIASHCSAEAGHRLILASLELAPLLDLDLRLGEASGAALAMPIVVAALATHAEMSTFAEAGVDVALESVESPVD